MDIKTQYMLIKIAEESLLSTKNNVCLGNLKGQINHDRTFIYDSGQRRECKFNFQVIKTSLCLRTTMLAEVYGFNTTKFNHFKSLAVALEFAISAILWFIGLVQSEFPGLQHALIAVVPVQVQASVPTEELETFLIMHILQIFLASYDRRDFCFVTSYRICILINRIDQRVERVQCFGMCLHASDFFHIKFDYVSCL